MDSTKRIKEAEMPQNICIGCLFVTEIIAQCHGLSTLSHLDAEYGTLLIWRDCQGLSGKFGARAPHDSNEFYLCVSGRFLSYLWHTLCGTHCDGCNFVVPDFEWISNILHICLDYLQGIRAATTALYINYLLRDGFGFP